MKVKNVKNAKVMVETIPRQLKSDIINKKISNLSIHRKEYYEKESKALESEIINIDDTESEQKLKELRFQVEEEILRRNIKHISISEYKELNVFRSNNLKYVRLGGTQIHHSNEHLLFLIRKI